MKVEMNMYCLLVVSVAVLVCLSVAVLSADLSFVLLGPNDASQWTEMELNKEPALVPTPYYSREEEKCFVERKVYYKGRCWELQTRGPCPEQHWLVLDPTSHGIKPECIPKLCPNDSAYWRPDQDCVRLKDRTKCTKKETSLQVDALGFGTCKCLKGAARAMASNGNCYLLYTRGFCDPGYVVGLDLHADEFPAICVPDVCKSSSPDKVLLPYKGSCYPEGSQEPCDEDQGLTVDVHSGLPTCSDLLLTWHVIQPPPLCSQVDHNKNCRDKLTVKKEVDNFILDINTDIFKHNKMFSVSKG